MDSSEDLALLQRIDAAATEFERELKAGRKPRIEQFVRRFEPPEQGLVFRSLLEIVLDHRHRSGKLPTVKKLQQRFPKFAKEIRIVIDQFRNGMPERIGPYRIDKQLGEGGMGAVYKAWHTKLRKTVAIKVLPPALANNEAAIARFDREMEAIGRLSHPNIIAARDADYRDGVHYLVMDYFNGVDVSQLAKHIGKMEHRDAVEIVRQACLGLSHAHEQGLVHRDLKPSNLFLGTDGIVRILDMGLARLTKAQTGELTASGQVMGTLDYMAPEQMAGSHDVDIRADIYSLGATLYRLITGTVPFPTASYSTLVAKLVAQAQQPPPSLHEVPQIPQGLADVCDCMLQPDPTERYSQPNEVYDALSEFADGAHLQRFFVKKGSPSKIEEALPTSPTGSTSQPANDQTLEPMPGADVINIELKNNKPRPNSGPAGKRAYGFGIASSVVVSVALLAALMVWSSGLVDKHGSDVTSGETAQQQTNASTSNTSFAPKTDDSPSETATTPAVPTEIESDASPIRPPTASGQPATSLAQNDRQIAEQLRRVGDYVELRLLVNKHEYYAPPGKPLPDEEFQILGAYLHPRKLAPFVELLARLSSLEELDFELSHMDGLSRLSEIKSLRRLSITSARSREEDYSFVDNLGQIEVLKFRYPNQPISIELIRRIGKLTQLHGLRIESLELPAEIFRELGSQTHLGSLELTTDATWVTPADCEPLTSLTNLQGLVLRFPKLDDAIWPLLSQFPKLGRLLVGSDELTGKGLRYLAESSMLYEVQVASTSFSEDGMRESGQLKQLSSLRPGQATDEWLVHWADMPLLKKVFLSHTGVTEKGNEALLTMYPDCVIE